VEKPSKDVAEGYVESGRFFRNAGIFLFSADVMLRLFETNAPEILSACGRALDAAVEDLNFLVLGDQYSQAEAILKGPGRSHQDSGQ
jgi:mannose-1-phosphate guanylyltransferase / mannose-6-phosphate isomerase